MDRIYGFVVLNYNNAKDTLECVESICAIQGGNYEVVVVDNCSTDGSQKTLIENLPRSVIMIESSQNGGYSYGNNIGIRYFLERNIKNIFIATNDTIIKSDDMLVHVEKMCIKHVGIVGPDIITPQGAHQNPSLKNINFLYIFNLYIPRLMGAIRAFIYLLNPRLSKFRNSSKQIERLNAKKELEVYMVHGSFFLITENYIDRVGGLDESLFMYHEEDLIAFNCLSSGLKILYSPAVTVLHKCGASTTKVWGSDSKATRKRMLLASSKQIRKKIKFTELVREYIKQL